MRKALSARWSAVNNSSVLIRQPSLFEHPARLLANASEHDFQGGRAIPGRGHFHRDFLQQAELLFARWIGGFSMFARFLVDFSSLAHSLLLRGQRATHGGKKLIVVKGLGEKRDGAQMKGGSFRGGILASRNDDHARVGRKRGKLRLNFQAAHLFHPNVENNERHRMCLNMRKELLRLVESADGKPVGGKQPSDRFKDRWVVIDQANNLRVGLFNGRHT